MLPLLKTRPLNLVAFVFFFVWFIFGPLFQDLLYVTRIHYTRPQFQDGFLSKLFLFSKLIKGFWTQGVHPLNEVLFSLHGQVISFPLHGRMLLNYFNSSFSSSMSSTYSSYCQSNSSLQVVFLSSLIRLKTYKLILHTILLILPNFFLVQSLDCFSWLLILTLNLDENVDFSSSMSWTSIFMVFSLLYSRKFRRYISTSRDFIRLGSFNPFEDWLGRQYHGGVKFTQHFVHNIDIVYR